MVNLLLYWLLLLGRPCFIFQSVEYTYLGMEAADPVDHVFCFIDHFDGLAQDCSNSIAIAMGLLQSSAKSFTCV